MSIRHCLKLVSSWKFLYMKNFDENKISVKSLLILILCACFCGFRSNWILPYFPLFVRPFVTGVTFHISHIYKGINAMLIIRGPIKPYIFWIKIILAIFLAKTRPDKTIFFALTNLTIDLENYQKYKCRIRSVCFVLLTKNFGKSAGATKSIFNEWR